MCQSTEYSLLVTTFSIYVYNITCIIIYYRKCSTPLSDYHNDLKASFSHQLTSQKQPSLPTLYGIVMSLCYLGGKVNVKFIELIYV